MKVTGNDNLKTLTIGGVTVTRSGTEDFVLTTAESGNKIVAIDGENVGSVTANGTLAVTYKTLPLSASGSGQYTYTGLKGNTAYTLRVNGVSISGQTTDFSVDKSLSAAIYAKTDTTNLTV